ncbi:MAG: hypothetical protein AAF078_10895, partial [Planctomycetota bacterium]
MASHIHEEALITSFTRPRRSPAAIAAPALALATAIAAAPTHAQPLDPTAFASLGTLNLAAGDFTIDTDTLTITDTTGGGSTLLFTGVADDQNGTADYFGGNWVPGTLGIPEIAVFTFDGINLQASANVSITGSRAIALLSQGDATIATPLSVDGSDGETVNTSTQTVVPGGAGGSGGFAGGGLAEEVPFLYQGLPGGGPGGGVGTFGVVFEDRLMGPPGAGAFGGNATDGSGGAPGGSAYGDLTDALQGGSGGGSAGNISSGTTGGGGGGAIELAAVGTLDIDADITARGGGDFAPGSGGGIRLSGDQIELDASLLAHAGDTTSGAGTAGGGQVCLAGQVADDFIYTVGQPTDALGLPDFSQINVEPSRGPSGDLEDADPELFGVITLSPALTIVPGGQTLDLSATIDASNPAESLNLFLDPLDVQVQRNGKIDIAAGTNIASLQEITLTSPDARIVSTTTANATLFNDGTLSGTGRVETLFNNRDGGTVNAINDTLTFTQPVTNQPGAQINAINAELTFTDGLDNTGDINLVNSTVTGDVNHNGTINAAGTNTFTGTFSGSGTITGNATIVFDGNLSPGNSPGSLTIEGNATLAPTATLELDITGTTPGTEHDTVLIGGDLDIDNALLLLVLDAFAPTAGQTFNVVTIDGQRTGTFNALTQGTVVASTAGVTLAIDYRAGDGNDLALRTLAAAALFGDLDLDGDVDLADIDLLLDNLGDPAFDLTDDATTDFADIEALLTGPLNSFPGDANLDGQVSTPDLAILAGSFNQAFDSWADADFTGDNFV